MILNSIRLIIEITLQEVFRTSVSCMLVPETLRGHVGSGKAPAWMKGLASVSGLSMYDVVTGVQLPPCGMG